MGKHSWDCIGVSKGAGALTSVHSKVTASMGDCLDQGGIFRRLGVVDTLSKVIGNV